MELPLKFEELQSCRLLFRGTLSREELSETIVPDAYPDVQTVLETECQAFLSRMEPAEGRADFSGSIRSQVLYRPEGAEGFVALSVTTPFQFIEERAGVSGNSILQAQVRVANVETRLLNPRKLLLRVELLIELQILEQRRQKNCLAVENPETWGIEQRCTGESGRFLCCAPVKAFSFTDQLSLPGTRPDAQRLLKRRCWASCGEARVVGSKVALKGNVYLTLLCQGQDGAVFPAEFDLPFSQVLDAENAAEGADVSANVQLTSLDCTLLDSGRELDVSMELLAQAVVAQEKTLPLLTDAYSIRYPTELSLREEPFESLKDSGVRRQSLREVLETGNEWESLQDIWTTLGPVTQAQEGTMRSLTAHVTVHALGTETGGVPAAASRSYTVSVQLETPGDTQVQERCAVTELHGERVSGGIEIRLTTVFRYEILRERPVKLVTGITLDETQEQELSQRPSIVLRRVCAGEELWSIAKAYSTTGGDICEANGLEEPTLTPGQLLLIPKRR